jgi:hypothetical protein
MARGQPDYNIPDYTFFSVETPSADIFAERYGFSRVDNRGRILWTEDFRNGLLRWTTDYDSVSSQVGLFTGLGLGAGYFGNVKLDPLSNGGFAGIHNRLLLSMSKRLGVEIGFSIGANAGELAVDLTHNFTGGVEKTSQLLIAHQTGAVKILSGGVYQTIATPSNIAYFQSRIVSVKYVIDLETGKYVRLMLGNVQYDLSSYSLDDGSAGFVGDTYISAYVNGKTATYKNPVYVSYIIISGDEP